VLSLFVACLTLWIALGCGGYTITKMEDTPPPAETTEAAPTSAAAPAPAPAPASAPAPAPAPAKKAGSGQIQVTTGAAVQAYVDGVPVAFDNYQGYVADVPAGTHTLEIMNLLGKIQATEQVDVPAGQRVRFTYKKKILSKTGTVAASALPPPPEPTVIVVEQPTPGSIQIAGLSTYGDAVWIDQYQVGYSTTHASFVRGGMEPGTYAIRVESGGQVVYEGPIDVRSGENHRCMLEFQGWERVLNCHWTRPAL